MAPVSVLLASYNSERYIGELMESILNQTHGDFTLFVRDDCSFDNTRRIVARFAEQDSRVKIIQNDTPSGSAGANFFQLLKQSALGDYIFFADADDVWLPQKIERTLAALRALEDKRGAQTPLLAHCDLRVVDQDLGEIASSMWRYEKLSPARRSLRELLCQNNITGCATAINRAAADKVGAVPAFAVMHDWWFGLVCAAFGEIAVIDEPLILYRQHGANQVGAYNARDVAASLKKLGRREALKATYLKMFRQAGEFAETYREQLSPEQYELCTQYAGMEHLGKAQKIARIVKYGFYKNTFARNLGQFWAI